MKEQNKKYLNIKKIKKQVKGITLIALVVTIIVLLILAGVALNLTIGQNGIFSRAQDAANTWKNAENNEQLAMNDLSSWMDQYLNGNGGSQGDNRPSTGVTIVDTVPIPTGFYYVGGTKSTGLVISDKKEDENKYDGQTEVPADGLVGNQFVWIPVDNSSQENFNKVFQRQNGYDDGYIDQMLSYCGESDGNGVNNRINETITTQEESRKMYKSVFENGGFYVGRFETGKDNNGLVVIKKGTDANPVNPYTNIKWSASGVMLETTGTDGGAVEISRNFDTINNYTSVTSTLIYGVQWDAIMNFIDPNYITNADIGSPNCLDTSFVKDSTNKGNYNQSSLTICGSSDSYRINNIYDLAGNASEWTMEAYTVSERKSQESDFRDLPAYYDARLAYGGNFLVTGLESPASKHFILKPNIFNEALGFRIAIYL